MPDKPLEASEGTSGARGSAIRLNEEEADYLHGVLFGLMRKFGDKTAQSIYDKLSSLLRESRRDDVFEGLFAPPILNCFASTTFHEFLRVDGNRFCGRCGGGRMHPIHPDEASAMQSRVDRKEEAEGSTGLSG